MVERIAFAFLIHPHLIQDSRTAHNNRSTGRYGTQATNSLNVDAPLTYTLNI